ncbi:MAG: rhomboid family intramembrane serine protease [Myxococcota bacterium]
MILLIPTGHSESAVRRIPWVTLVIMAICLLVQIQAFVSPPPDDPFDALMDREALIEELLYDYEMEEASPEGQEAFIVAFQEGFAGDPDDPLRDELDAAEKALEEAQNRPTSLLDGYRPADGGGLPMIVSAFVHDGWFGLIGNLLFLYLVGSTLEERWTKGGFAVLYLMGIIVSAATYGLVNPGTTVPLIGASGAVAAAMGAFVVVLGGVQVRFVYIAWAFIYVRTGNFSTRAYVALGVWLVMHIFIAWLEGAVGPSGTISHSAQLGGFAFGLAVGGIMRFTEWDAKLHALANAKTFDIFEHVPNAAMSPELVEQVERYIHEASREGKSAEILDLYDLVNKRGDIPLGDRSLLMVGQAAGDLGEATLAVSVTHALMTRFPKSPCIPRAMWDTAKVQRSAGRPDLAEKTLRNLVRHYPHDPFAQSAREELTG